MPGSAKNKVKKSHPDVAHVELCRGCMVCTLRCSLHHGGSFAPSRAFIRVTERMEAPAYFDVDIIDGCDGCGICAANCPYGVLETVGGKK